MAQGQPFIIITGAGRSGTSAVARVLHESGLSMGERLAEPAHFNPDGFYEDLDVVCANEQIMAGLGLTDPWAPERRPRRATVLAAATPYRDEMAAVASRAGGGWKDPRFSITLEAWLPILPSPPKVIVCLRRPEAFVESVVQVYGLVSRERATQKWVFHYRRLLAVIRDYDLDARCVEYDALVERPRETVAALSTFVDHPLRPEFVNPVRRNHVSDRAQQHDALYRRVLALSPVAAISATPSSGRARSPQAGTVPARLVATRPGAGSAPAGPGRT